MSYRSVKDMYPAVCQWLKSFLDNKHPNAEVHIFDSSRKSLARLIQEAGLLRNLPSEWPSWNLYVDIVGFACTEKMTAIAFVECKNEAITLAHLSQLLGYSRIALPQYSIILASQGSSSALQSLLITYGRTDVLQYQNLPGRLPRSIAIAKWDELGACLDHGSIICGDDNVWR